MRRRGYIPFLFGVIVATAVLAIFYFTFAKESENGIEKEETDEKDRQTVVVAVARIDRGEVIQSDKLQIVERAIEEVPLNAALSIELIEGKRAVIPVEANTVLTETMLISPVEQEMRPEDRLKDYELPSGLFTAGMLHEGDYIDVEYVKANGDTFTVLSKKRIGKTLQNRLVLQVTMTERNLINHAIAEQGARGGRIETVLYVDESQPASKVTYIPAALKEAEVAAAATQTQAVETPEEPQQPFVRAPEAE